MPEQASSHPLAGRRHALAYGVFWLAVGVLQSLAALQDYVRRGGGQAWKPWLWELSSVLVVALLALAVYRYVAWVQSRHWPAPRVLLAHVPAALTFAGLHIAGMSLLRAAGYAVAGERYDPGNLGFVLGYESAKDLVTYAILAGLSVGVLNGRLARAHRERLLRLEAELACTRLDGLRAQLHPHFLFNTLNLVSGVMHEDVDRADALLEKLAELLRASLATGGQAQHTLKAELAPLECYLTLMQARFADRLRIERDIDEVALDCLVPCMCLQPLAENAFQHGIEPAAGPAVFRLSARCADGRLVLRLADDVGRLVREQRPGGIGLRNVRERLRLHYGDAAELRLEALAPAGVALSLNLPGRTA